MDVLMQVLKNPAFWTALIGLLNAIVLAFVPAFPKEVLTAFNSFVAVIAAIVTGNTAVQFVRARIASKNDK